MPPSQQSFEDASHLRSLAITHYVFAVLTGLLSCFSLIYIFMGGAIVLGKFPMTPPAGATPPPPGTLPPQDMSFMGWFFVIFGLVFLLIGLATAICQFLAARWLTARKNRTFCFVVACVECLSVPLGTLLGVFTILVLSRPSVRALFDAGPGENNFTRQ